MNTAGKVVAYAGLSVVALSLLAAGVIAGSPARHSWWTDGASIREHGREAPVRRVLWSPSQTVPGVDGDEADTYEAKFSFDGSTMVFVRRRPGKNADLFSARRTPQGWTTPAPIDSVNTEHDELGPEFSQDGTSLYFYSDRSGGLGGYDLWVSRITEGEWGTPINLGPAINTEANEYGPALSPDGTTLYFSSNRRREGEASSRHDAWPATLREERGRHDYDLYTSNLRAGEPAQAVAFDAINTPSDEGAPAISPGGDFLYFASDRPGGLGGFDVYRSRLSKAAPLAPENLGASVNSAFNDLDPGLSSDGFRLCFSSDRAAARDQPGPDVPGVAPHRPPIPQRYRLWTTVSREVYEEIETSSRTAGLVTLWDSIWPWLFLLAVMGVLLALLSRIFASQAWRRRLGQLSLLARCLLASLLIHALLASGLAVWKVGSGMINAVRREGGTRVILASVASAPDVGAQVLSPAGSEVPMITPPLNPISASSAGQPFEAARVETRLPVLMSPAVAPISASMPGESPPTVPSSLAVSDGPERAAVDPVASLPRSVPPPPVRSEHAADVPSVADLGAIATVPASPASDPHTDLDVPRTARASVDVPPLRWSDSAVAAPTDSNAAPANAATPAPGTESGGVDTVRLPPLPRTGGSEAEAIPIDPLPRSLGAPSAPTPSSDSLVGRAEVPLPAFAPSSSTGTLLPSLRGREAMTDPPKPSVSLLVPPASGATGSIGAEAAIPRPAGVPGQSAEPKVGGAPRLPSPLQASTVQAAGTRSPSRVTVELAPERPAAPDSAGRRLAFDHASPTSDGSLASRPAVIPSPSPVPASDDLSAIRIPDLPVGPVTPVETFAQRAPEVRAEVLERMGGSAETERAVGLALEWFARHQEPDGHWSGRHFDDACGRCGDPSEFDADGAMTGMALLCYLGAGHTHLGDGPYRERVSRAIHWLVQRQAPNGDLRRGETMYGQTVATVALCEALAMTKDQELADPARRAVAFVLAANSPTRAARSSQDTAVLGWLIMAVESARRAGIEVPRDPFDAAERWLVYVSAPGTPGRYCYGKGERPSVEMTAEAMFVRQLVGHGRTEGFMEESARYVLSVPPRWTEGAPTLHWYYATLALFEHQGDAWRTWNSAIVPELVSHQRPDGPGAGSWDPQDRWSRMGGRIYQTAVCTLSLEVYYRYRPR